ncbi:DUF3010 family protein [Alteromonas gilva]|uniref:DUF3010 family protein n=1 Tax=Alteromonas gilva TaxID=2987522 RepID=A0ABT5KWS5_9ALTE|nr:DUF3010 family protein [Alteromonas gilva]MDC8829233.1 DUF3010 family protein [Alteromonas gilva]
MRIVCGIEIKGSEAIVALLALDRGLFQVPDCRVRRVALQTPDSAHNLRYFQRTVAKLLADYKTAEVVIRERPTKGKFAGGAVGFKLEACIQLINDIEVTLLSSSQIKQRLKRQPLTVPFTETGLKGFQQGAFETAYAFLCDQPDPAE